MRAIIFIVPILQSLIFGYAVTTDVNTVATVVLDRDNSVESRDLIAAFAHSGYFDVKRYLESEGEIDGVMNHGDAVAVLHIENGFERAINQGRTAPMQIIIDGVDSNTAGIVAGYVQRIVQDKSNLIFKDSVVRAYGISEEMPTLALESRAWFNENLESRNYYVPGVLATILTLVTLTLTSMAIVREKEVGTMEQIMVTPITKFEFILGKSAPFVIIGFIDVIAILLVALFWFEVPLRGSLLLLFFSVALYLMNTLGIGLFISTISLTQQQAMMSVFIFYFPAILLSGFIFPIANMPEVIQWVTLLNPMKYFLIIIRGIFLKGVGLRILWPQLCILALMGSFVIAMATRRFRKQMV